MKNSKSISLWALKSPERWCTAAEAVEAVEAAEGVELRVKSEVARCRGLRQYEVMIRNGIL